MVTSSRMQASEQPSDVQVWLAISSYRNDQAVASLLEQAAAFVPTVFQRVLVVDSKGTGKIPSLIQERGWTFVDYESADENLGSAGNFARRLTRAADEGADYVYALNHDGRLSRDTVTALISAAKRARNLAVLYPLRRLVNQGGAFDVTGRLRWPVPRMVVKKPPPGETFAVCWGSSNGSLYSLDPVRKGLAPWADLWMGFEDLGYGWLLTAHGYEQVVVNSAVFDDTYEFKAVLRGVGHRSDKAAWYSYYFARNLVLVARRSGQPALVRTAVGVRLVLEALISATVRPDRRKRLSLICKGLAHGILGKSGFEQAPAE